MTTRINQCYTCKGLESLNITNNPTYIINDPNIGKNDCANIIVNIKGENKMVTGAMGYLPLHAQKKSPKHKKYDTFNARTETIKERTLWRNAINKYHCAIPVAGFYKWEIIGWQKNPYIVEHQNNEITYLAGFFNYVENEVGENVAYRFAILTSSYQVPELPNNTRMPFKLEAHHVASWLNHKITRDIVKSYNFMSHNIRRVSRALENRDLKNLETINYVG